MIIKAVHVKNFRSILDERIDCDNLTVLVGRNGTGKSSFLRALQMFYDPKASVVAEDFYAEDTSKEIEIAVTFTDLSTEYTAPQMGCQNHAAWRPSRSAMTFATDLVDQLNG